MSYQLYGTLVEFKVYSSQRAQRVPPNMKITNGITISGRIFASITVAAALLLVSLVIVLLGDAFPKLGISEQNEVTDGLAGVTLSASLIWALAAVIVTVLVGMLFWLRGSQRIALGVLALAIIAATVLAVVFLQQGPSFITTSSSTGSLVSLPRVAPFAIFGATMIILLASLISPDSRIGRALYLLLLAVLFIGLPTLWAFRPTPEIALRLDQTHFRVAEDVGTIEIGLSGESNLRDLSFDSRFAIIALSQSAIEPADFAIIEPTSFIVEDGTFQVTTRVKITDDDIIEGPEFFSVAIDLNSNPFIRLEGEHAVKVEILDNDGDRRLMFAEKFMHVPIDTESVDVEVNLDWDNSDAFDLLFVISRGGEVLSRRTVSVTADSQAITLEVPIKDLQPANTAGILQLDVTATDIRGDRAYINIGVEYPPNEAFISAQSVFGSTPLIPTTRQAANGDSGTRAIATLVGRPHTNYLRVGIGATYQNGTWSAAPDIASDNLEYHAGDEITESMGLEQVTFTANEIPMRWLPVPYNLHSVSEDGEYNLHDFTFQGKEPVLQYSFQPVLNKLALSESATWSRGVSPFYQQLPDEISPQIQELALKITANAPSDYAKAKAIEEYLSTEYTYSYANNAVTAIQPGKDYDAVEKFLFEQRSGTCGNFSSAMVLLTRSVGLPARPVLGWYVNSKLEQQEIYAKQSHQWVEVLFDEVGWVEFEPTAGGAPSRVGQNDELDRQDTLPQADQSPLANGITIDQLREIETVFPTTRQATPPMNRLIAELDGVSQVPYLRVTVGEVYEDGTWLEGPQLASQEVSTARFDMTTGNLEPVKFSWHEGTIKRLPVPLNLQYISENSDFYHDSMTIVSKESVSEYEFAVGHNPTPQQQELIKLNRNLDGYRNYLQLPDNLSPQMQILAFEITASAPSDYAKAKAIEQHLRSNYAYGYANTAQASIQPDQDYDPVEEFLFERKTGTCGNFSSAMVLLARIIGLPARPVAGFAINPSLEAQEIYIEQAHQWVEIQFDEVGWVSFEPTASGAPSRVPGVEDSSNTAGPEPTNPVTSVSDIALENGSSLGAGGRDFNTGTTAQATRPSEIVIGHINGRTNIGYLRTGVGQAYEDGAWLSPEREFRGETTYRAGQIITAGSSSGRATFSLLGWRTRLLPVPQNLRTVSKSGTYQPYSLNFMSNSAVSEYQFESFEQRLSKSARLTLSRASNDENLQLPDNFPQRITSLARTITVDAGNDYDKARAIEQYLKDNYKYSFADSAEDAIQPNSGYDPVEEFLFERRVGTCGNFSSAMVLLARSIGLPTRPVVGWVINATATEQDVYTDQAHQWVEVLFDEVGWIAFEPTAAGAPERARRSSDVPIRGNDAIELIFPEEVTVKEGVPFIEIEVDVVGDWQGYADVQLRLDPQIAVDTADNPTTTEGLRDLNLPNSRFQVLDDENSLLKVRIEVIDDDVPEMAEVVYLTYDSALSSRGISTPGNSSTRIVIEESDLSVSECSFDSMEGILICEAK